jgi:hypothetical protein
VVERIRAQALADDQLAQQIQQLSDAKQQALADVARLRAQERELREQAHARAATEPMPVRMADPPFYLSRWTTGDIFA